jgi:diguanylate cyclase (GGDEF)-like protein/PAS domain S-box-containing protein
MLSIVAGLMVVAILLIQSTAQKGVKALNRYVEELDAVTAEMCENEKKYGSLFAQSNDGIFIKDLEGNILEANLKMLEMFGATEQEMLSGKALDLHPPEASEQAAGALRDIIKDGSLRYEIRFRKRSGKTFLADVSSSLIQAGGRRVIQSIIRDITEQKEFEERLRAQSITDELTGLLNRRGFITLANQQLKIANRSRRGMYLLFADIDRLKEVNDTLGHHEGDRALLEIATLFKKNVRDSDIVARLGGDEFVALMVDVSGAADETIITERMLTKLEALNRANRGRNYILSISMGLAYYDPQEACSVEELLMRADSSMYREKKGKAGRAA